jgi:hypothetical protein
MKFKIDIKSLVLGVVLAAVIVFAVAAATPACGRTVWEYKTVAGRVLGGEQNLGDAVNATIGQGWEFVSASYAIDQLGFAVMRREKK